MRSKGVLCLIGLSAGLFCPQEASALFLINEFLADPPTGAAGDANQDGVRDAADDEFVELLNPGEAGIDLTGWSLWDRLALRHSFSSGITLGPSQRLVIFGGGRPGGIPGLAAAASTGALSLNNTGDSIRLRDSSGLLMDEILFSREADEDQSLNRFPEGAGPFAPHRSISSVGLSFSPGTDPDGKSARESPPPVPLPPDLPEEFERPPSVVPEPSSGVLLGLGLILMKAFKRRSKGAPEIRR